jgi:asparagine synthase (glutamine-hydrolysing)
MCSISGILESGAAELSLVERDVRTMNSALKHRGPDDEGVLSFSAEGSRLKLSLGNTRLSIIDTSYAGHQPMIDPETGNCLTYNGETYNFQELRSEIGNEFGPWRSNTDTEVVLRAYRKWGVDAFTRLRGMFALALWDSSASELILVRDPLGIKPLYYSFEVAGENVAPKTDEQYQIKSLIFASELRALLATGRVSRNLNRAGVNSYLEFGSAQSPLTLIENVWSLMPGHCVRVSWSQDILQLSLTQFESIAEGHPNGHAKKSVSISELRQELQRSVELHLVSDVPLGVFLSGGMDSSALLALMTQVAGDKPKTFSVVFDEKRFSEAAPAQFVADKFQTDHREVHLSDSDLLEMLPAAISSLDQPSMDGVNTFVISKAVKAAGISVALSGLGGDELFAGYPSFRRVAKLRSLKYVPDLIRPSIVAAGKSSADAFARRNKFWQLAASHGTPKEVYSITRQLFSPSQIASITMPGNERMATNGNGVTDKDVVNAMSRLELQGYMANTLLRDTDCMSMAHSLEVRVPFVDKSVVRKALSIPGDWKLDNRKKVPKPLLAAALGDLLPMEFLSRPKMGFTLPFEQWILSKLRGSLAKVFADEKLLDAAFLNPSTAAQLFQRFNSAPNSVGWSRPWAMYVLAKWCEINDVSRAGASI